MTETTFAPRLHGEGHQVEESAELEQATGKPSEVPANVVPRKTARLSASVKVWQRLFLRLRDGYSCRICGVDGSKVRLDIHHINGDPGDNSPDNLRLLCHKCNVNEYSKRFHSILTHSAGGSEREKTPPTSVPSLIGERKTSERSSECERKDVGVGECFGDGSSLPVRDASLELMINREKEPLFRRIVLNLAVSRSEGLTVHEALHEVAERVGISPITARRYLDKMTSRAGPLRVGEGRRGHEPLLPRESYWNKNEGEVHALKQATLGEEPLNDNETNKEAPMRLSLEAEPNLETPLPSTVNVTEKPSS